MARKPATRKAPAPKTVKAETPEPDRNAVAPGETSPWNRVGSVPLRDGKVYIAAASGRQVEVLHRRGDFFADNGGSFSRRLDGVTHLRERPNDPR